MRQRRNVGCFLCSSLKADISEHALEQITSGERGSALFNRTQIEFMYDCISSGYISIHSHMQSNTKMRAHPCWWLSYHHYSTFSFLQLQIKPLYCDEVLCSIHNVTFEDILTRPGAN